MKEGKERIHILGRPSKQTQTHPIRDLQLYEEARKLTMGMNGRPLREATLDSAPDL